MLAVGIEPDDKDDQGSRHRGGRADIDHGVSLASP